MSRPGLPQTLRVTFTLGLVMSCCLRSADTQEPTTRVAADATDANTFFKRSLDLRSQPQPQIRTS